MMDAIAYNMPSVKASLSCRREMVAKANRWPLPSDGDPKGQKLLEVHLRQFDKLGQPSLQSCEQSAAKWS